MSGNNGRGLENYNPQDWTESEGSNQAHPPHPLRSNPPTSTTPRSITPRGAIFTNLGEAHQAITSRLASRSAGNRIPDTPSQTPSVSSANATGPTSSAGSLSSDQHLETTESTSPAPFLRPSMSTAEWDKALAQSSPAAASCGHNSGEDSPNRDARDASPDQVSSETESTVEDIYEQYMPSQVTESPSSIMRPADKDSQHPETTSESAQEDATATRCPTEHVQNPGSPKAQKSKSSGPGTTRAKNRRQLYSPPSDPPKAPLPELPHPHRDVQHPVAGLREWPKLSPTTQSANSVTNFGDLLREPTKGTQGSARAHNNDSEPAQLATHLENNNPFAYGSSRHAHEHPADPVTHENDMSQCEVSIGGGTSDSDDDPFRYDRGSLTLFLKPSREREVSVALRCVSEDSTASSNGNLQSPSSNGPPTPRPPPFSANEPVDTGKRAIQSNNPFFNKLQFYQTPVVNYDWNDEDDTNQVKISIQPKSAPTSAPPPVPPNSPVLSALSPADFAQNLEKLPRTDKVYTLMSDGIGDWETVATTVGQFDSNRAFASSTAFSAFHPTKSTGSSIADYSDAGSFEPIPLDPFASTERILPHPTTGPAPNTRYRRTLKDTGRPVFLPKPRIHRVNGYLQNPSRIFTDPTTGSSGTSARSYLVEKLSASIRSRGARKRAQPRNPYYNLERLSNSGSLDSFFSTDVEQKSGTNSQEKGCTSEATPGGDSNCLAVVKTHEGEQSHRTTDEWPRVVPVSSKHTSIDQQNGPTLFNFPLISLEEAARRQALMSENGEDNVTITSGARTRKDSSVNSSRATQRTTPPTPHITRPLPTHRRYPTPAGIPGSTMSYHRYSGYSQERNLAGHRRGLSDTVPFRPGAPLVTRQSVLSRPFRNTFDSIATSSANRPSYFGPPSVLDSPRLFGHDKWNRSRPANVTTDLLQIAHMETATPFGILAEDQYLSWEARKRRQTYYYTMCILCIFPFMAPLIYRGTFDSALSWYTRGETSQLNQRQRRNVFLLGSIVSAIWLCSLAVFVTLAINGKQKTHA